MWWCLFILKKWARSGREVGSVFVCLKCSSSIHLFAVFWLDKLLGKWWRSVFWSIKTVTTCHSYSTHLWLLATSKYAISFLSTLCNKWCKIQIILKILTNIYIHTLTALTDMNLSICYSAEEQAQSITIWTPPSKMESLPWKDILLLTLYMVIYI